MNIPRRKPLSANIGVVGVGLDTYWAQFDGLLDELNHKKDIFIDKSDGAWRQRDGFRDDRQSAKGLCHIAADSGGRPSTCCLSIC